jgi:hypothetical protein
MKAMCLDQELKRLYLSSYDGQFFIFNIQGITPIILHSFAFDHEIGFCKQIDNDTYKNILFCLTK